MRRSLLSAIVVGAWICCASAWADAGTTAPTSKASLEPVAAWCSHSPLGTWTAKLLTAGLQATTGVRAGGCECGNSCPCPECCPCPDCENCAHCRAAAGAVCPICGMECPLVNRHTK